MLIFKVDNPAPFFARLDAFVEEYEQDVRELNRVTAATALATARQVSPKDTGYMSSQLKMELSDDGLRWSVGWEAADFIGHINPFDGRVITTFYVLPAEFGSVNSPAQPTLEPTRAAVGPAYLAELRDLNREAVARYNRK